MDSDIFGEVVARPNRKVVVYVTEAEYNAFLEALRKSGRYHSISDALRDFIRDFNDKMGVMPGVKKHRITENRSNGNGSFVDADGDCEVLDGKEVDDL